MEWSIVSKVADVIDINRVNVEKQMERRAYLVHQSPTPTGSKTNF